MEYPCEGQAVFWTEDYSVKETYYGLFKNTVHLDSCTLLFHKIALHSSLQSRPGFCIQAKLLKFIPDVLHRISMKPLALRKVWPERAQHQAFPAPCASNPEVSDTSSFGPS